MEPVDNRQKQDQSERSRREVLLALFLLLLRKTRDKLTTVVHSYLLESIHTEDLSEELITILTDAHAMAVSLGQQLAGERGDNTQRNRQLAIAVMVGQTGYLSNLVHDLRSGRYPLVDGELPPLLVRRMTMYAQVLRTTADQAWIASLPAGTLIHWRTTAGESCPGCLAQEAANPHIAGQMTEFPGDEQCGPNCRCVLEVVGGTSGFELPEGNDL